MTPGMMPPQQGGENEQIVDQIIGLVTQMLEMAGPEWVMEFLTAGMEAVQQGSQAGAGGMPPDAMAPDVMSEGGPAAMPGPAARGPQVPGSIAPPPRGMMGRKLPN